MTNFQILFIVNYILCFLAIFGMIFVEHKKPVRIIAWSLALIVFPFVGLFIYILIGYGLGISTKRMLKKRELSNNRYNESLKQQIKLLNNDSEDFCANDEFKELIMLNIKNANSVFSTDNQLKYYSFGKDMACDLKKDLIQAKKQ